jgi:hypothetical protein
MNIYLFSQIRQAWKALKEDLEPCGESKVEEGSHLGMFKLHGNKIDELDKLIHLLKAVSFGELYGRVPTPYTSLKEPSGHPFCNMDFSRLEFQVLASQAITAQETIDRDPELQELGFVVRQGSGICGCATIPCFQGKYPDQSSPTVPCAIIQSMCSQSPRESMKESREYEKE